MKIQYYTILVASSLFVSLMSAAGESDGEQVERLDKGGWPIKPNLKKGSRPTPKMTSEPYTRSVETRKRETEIRSQNSELTEAEKPKKTCFSHSQIKRGRNLIAGSIQILKSGSKSHIAFTTFKENRTFYNYLEVSPESLK